MIFKTHRQSRIDVMDDDLACLRLWRKPIAKDDCSLYRAVSEQLFLCQTYHEEIRDRVMVFIEKNHDRLKSEWTTRIEFLAISLLFNCDIIVYQFGRSPIDLTLNNFEKKVNLCVSGGNHYDCVYPYTYKEIGAICQSILYDVLYRKVFKVGDDVIKEGLDILHCKQYHRNKKFSERGEHCFLHVGHADARNRWSPRKDLPPHPPFPYRVAKALDPVIYRNVEYDNWVDSVKDCASDLEPTFQMGDKCQVILEKEVDKIYYAHIQDITAGKGPVTVFIEELGEKHNVDYESLRPVPQPHHYDTKRKGKKKDYFLPFSRSGAVLGMKATEDDHQKSEGNKELSTAHDERRSPTTSDSNNIREANNEDNWYGKPRQYLNSIGHPVKVRWNGVTVRHLGNKGYLGHKQNQNNNISQHDNRQGFNKNVHHQDGNESTNYRQRLRNGKGGIGQQLGEQLQQKYPSQPAQRNAKRPQDRQDNLHHGQRLDLFHKEEFLDNNLQNSGYQPGSNDIAVNDGNVPPMISVPNGTALPQSFSNQFVPPPPLSMPPTNYGGSPLTYPLSMYPYLVLPPIGCASSPVNYTAGPSQDPSGNDLPISDPSTLRYFYNLGYECHRLSNIHLGQFSQVPPPASLPPSYSCGPMLESNTCPPPEEYWTECAELDMPPGVIVQNEWSDILIGPPPNCPGGFQQVHLSPTGGIPNLGSSIPIGIPNGQPQVNGTPVYQPTTLPMQWNSLSLYTMPPPNCDM